MLKKNGKQKQKKNQSSHTLEVGEGRRNGGTSRAVPQQRWSPADDAKYEGVL